MEGNLIILNNTMQPHKVLIIINLMYLIMKGRENVDVECGLHTVHRQRAGASSP
jgi:hypothetical protein